MSVPSSSSSSSSPSHSPPHGARLSFTPSPAQPSVLDSTCASPLPTCVLVIGMAGSGKTTLMHSLLTHCAQFGLSYYSINLDPGVLHLPYQPHIDIRDTVKYKGIQKHYNLGPNGAILTSLNLFATRFDQVLALVQKRAPSIKYLFIDTPGQIEVFTWSASGVILSEALSCTFPTVVLYCCDTPRCTSPVSFMSNMLYACSIMYKARLPFFLAFNKTDIVSDAYAREWMQDLDSFVDALNAMKSSESGGYMHSLTKSMSLVLDEFYRTITATGVSALTQQGIGDLLTVIDDKRKEFYNEFIGALRERMEMKRKQEEKRIAIERAKFARDRQGDVLVDLKRDRRIGLTQDEEWLAEEEEQDDDVDEAEDQDDEYERRIEQMREKREFDEFMSRIKSNQNSTAASPPEEKKS